MPGFSTKLPSLPGLLWIAALWLLFYSASDSFAQTPAPKPDNRVLIDVSGSMKHTDPDNLRVPALKLLINLAKDDSRLGIWLFGQQVNNLVPVAPVSKNWKASATKAADAIHSRALFTNIGAALEAASLGQTKPDPAWDRTLVLLSDGMVDISKDPAVNEKEKARILDTVIPGLRKAGFRIHTLALSDQADKAFLETLAMQTGGTFTLARNADELLKAFVSTSDKVYLPEQVPLEGDTFSIDESIREFTALIFRKSGGKETRLKAPDGQEYSQAKPSRNLNWFSDKLYDLVTFYNPPAGNWQVLGDLDPSNRVTVVSDLEIETDGLPDHLVEGEKATLSMHLSEQGRTITNPQFLGLLDITFSQITGQGEKFEGKLSQDRNGDPNVPENGIYHANLGRTLTQGDHRFTVIVDGKTFKRQKIHHMKIVREVVDVRTGYRDENGQLAQYLLAEPRPGLADPERLELIAQIEDSKGDKSLQTASLADGRWKIEVPPLSGLGVYQVSVKVKGTTPGGEPFEQVQGPYTIDYTPLAKNGLESQPPSPLGDRPTVSFDASAMEIPSLEISELPVDDVLPDAEPQVAVPTEQSDGPGWAVEETAKTPDANETQAEERGEVTQSSWWLWGSLLILGNALLVGVVLFFYLRFLRKTAVKDTQVIEEISELHQKNKEDVPSNSPEPAMAFDPVVSHAIEEEATLLRTGDLLADMDLAETPETASVTEPAGVVVEAALPEVNKNYVNDEAPLELEDDQLVEVDDYVDDYIEEEVADAENLDDLGMVMNDQEPMGDTELNRTIDTMLEQPAGEKKSADDFADDEFMLDNPDIET